MMPADGPDEMARLAGLRRALVESLQQRGTIADARVAEAFDAVPRHLFLPAVAPEEVYSDRAIVTKEQDGVGISSSSQPAIMAIMLQQLALEPGLRVLEIGAGTGYNAALLARLVGPAGRVTTVDIDQDIVDAARAHLAAAGGDGVRVERGDGGRGWPDDAPYDRIVLTVGAADVLPAWVEQLRPDGLLVLPLFLDVGQYSVALRKLPDGTLASESLVPCGFMPLRGAFAYAERQIETGAWSVRLGERLARDPASASRVATLLDQPLGEEPLPDGPAGAEEAASLALHRAFAGAPAAYLCRTGPSGPANPADWFIGLLDTDAGSGCLLRLQYRPADGCVASGALLFGSRAAYDRLLADFARWNAAGRPRLDDLRVLVYPRDGVAPPQGVPSLAKPQSTLVLGRRDGRPL
ncbi:MAG: methyltransferase domain-containing protein [Chloroflexota bacterium]|nr:methyltransferase domain-containing protein [Chloroflexota bacterium]